MKKKLVTIAWFLALSSVFFVPRGLCVDCGQIQGLLDREVAARNAANGDLEKCRREITASINDAKFNDCWGKSAGPDAQYARMLGENVARHAGSAIHDPLVKQGVLQFVRDIEAAFYDGKHFEAFRQFSVGFTEFLFTHPDVSEELRGQILAGLECAEDNCRYRLSKAERLPPDGLKQRMGEFVASLEKIPALEKKTPEGEAAKPDPRELTETSGEKDAPPETPPPATEEKNGATFFVLAALLAVLGVAAIIAAFLFFRRQTGRSGLKRARTAKNTGKNVFPSPQGREKTGPALSVVLPPPPAETARAANVQPIIPVSAMAVEEKPLWALEQEADLDQRLDGLYAEIERLRAAIEAEKGQGAKEAARVLKIAESLISRTQEDFQAAQRSFFKARTRGFFDKNRGLYEVVVNEVQSRDRELYRQLARELPQLVAGDETLSASFRNAAAALDEYHSHVSMLEHIIRAFKEEERGAVTGNSLERHHLIGSCLNYMDVIQYSGQIPVIAGFKPEKWVRESFLGTADLVLKERQRLQPGAESAKLEKAAALVIEVLSRAGVEAEPIVLCETRFDSKSHVVRSTVNRPDLPDGVITDVVRNGFSYRDGRSIQQAEVIVNRSRA